MPSHCTCNGKAKCTLPTGCDGQGDCDDDDDDDDDDADDDACVRPQGMSLVSTPTCT
jgi:hypothetical protein